MRLGHSVASLALHISNIFFHRRAYVNFDRFVTLTACILLATKLKDMDSRLKSLCSCFHKVILRQNILNSGGVSGNNSQSEVYTE